MSKKIKILVISYYSDMLSSRPEAEIFLKLIKLGVEIDIMTDARSFYARKFMDAGIKVIDHTAQRKISVKTIRLIKKTLTKGKHDIILLYNSKAIINGLIATTFIDTKAVLYRGCAGNISSWDPFAYLKYLNPRVDKVICNAKSAEILLQKKFLFKKDKAITIHKGHDASWYSNVLQTNLTELNIPEGSFTICCSANARPVKGVRFLLEAFKYIDHELPIHLILIGSGHEDKVNKKIMKELKQKNHIHVLGYRKDSLSIVKACDVFMLPSVAQETLTKSVIEAMSMAVTAVITNVTGNQALVLDKKTGLIVPTKSPKSIATAIVKLFHNRAYCKKLGYAGQQHIQNQLGGEKTAMEYLQLFKDLAPVK